LKQDFKNIKEGFSYNYVEETALLVDKTKDKEHLTHIVPREAEGYVKQIGGENIEYKQQTYGNNSEYWPIGGKMIVDDVLVRELAGDKIDKVTNISSSWNNINLSHKLKGALGIKQEMPPIREAEAKIEELIRAMLDKSEYVFTDRFLSEDVDSYDGKVWVVPESISYKKTEECRTDEHVISNSIIWNQQNMLERLEEKLGVVDAEQGVITYMTMHTKGCHLHGFVMTSDYEIMKHEVLNEDNIDTCLQYEV
jgi:hypothetical protein